MKGVKKDMRPDWNLEEPHSGSSKSIKIFVSLQVFVKGAYKDTLLIRFPLRKRWELRFSNQSTRQQRLREDMLDKNQITCHLCLTGFFCDKLRFLESSDLKKQATFIKQEHIEIGTQKVLYNCMINSHNTNKHSSNKGQGILVKKSSSWEYF